MIKVRKATLIVIPLFVIFSLFSHCNIWLFLSTLFFICVINHCSFNLTNNIFFVFFLITFFTFLMSAQLAHDFFGYEMQYVSEAEEFDFLNLCIFWSLLFLTLGYFLGRFLGDRSKVRSRTAAMTRKRKEYGVVSKYLFYIFAIPWYAVLIEQCIVVQTSRYVDLYTFDSSLPGIVLQMAEACPIVFCLFLASFPTKKEAKIPISIVIIYALISLLNGRRLYFVTYLFLLVVYWIIRTYENGSTEIWISKKQIRILLAMIPVLVIFLYSYKYIRYDREIEANNFFDAFIGFFAQQGFSANLIVTGRKYADLMTDDVYSFYNTIRFMRINIFSKHVLGLDYSTNYFGTRTEQAFLSGSFSRIMTYILKHGAYLRGYGVGSCYIAELYHDLGYAGIALGNLFYGLLIGMLLRLNEYNTFGNTVALMMFIQLLSASRYNYDRVFSLFYSFNFWAVIIIAFIGVEIVGLGRKTYARI